MTSSKQFDKKGTFMDKNLLFNVYEDMTKISDSVLLESDTVIADLISDDVDARIIVRGEINITYKNKNYRHPSEYSEELKQLISSGKNWFHDKDIYVSNNNWFECIVNDICDTDIVNAENCDYKKLYTIIAHSLNKQIEKGRIKTEPVPSTFDEFIENGGHKILSYIDKSNIPFYEKDLNEAKKNGELNEWRASYIENNICAKDIDKTISDCNKDYCFDTDMVIDLITEKFGLNRVKHVIAAHIIHHEKDNNFCNEVKNWAKNEMKKYSNTFIEESRVYYLYSPSTLINILAYEIMNLSAESDKSTDKNLISISDVITVIDSEQIVTICDANDNIHYRGNISSIPDELKNTFVTNIEANDFRQIFITI